MSLRNHPLKHSAHKTSEQPHCAELINHGTHSTVEVSAGTPPQRFDLVADTGSNAVIILSCNCVDEGRCSSQDDCFRGTDKSSTFSIGKLSDNSDQEVPSVTMSFGSGDIQAVIATDEVSVGGVKTSMKNGLLLMVDKALNIDGPFEGILGLGLPSSARWGAGLMQNSRMKLNEDGEDYEPPEFLPEADISRFSLCFNNGASGALRLNSAHQQDKLGSFGQIHWGVGLTGVFVGNGKNPVQLDVCRPDYDGGPEMPAGQVTVCGGIPDSGTTAIMAPESSLEVLFEGICDEWDRCKKSAKKMHMTKAQAFVDVLADCGSWLDDDNSEGLSELPTLHFRVQGAQHGQIQDLELAGWFYVFETVEEQYELVSEHFRAFAPQGRSLHAHAGTKKTCAPAFGVMDMPTKTNGDAWILGTSFFYAYNVHYDLDYGAMAFVDEPCGSCSDSATLVSQGTKIDSRALARSPRQVHGSWRVSHFNTTAEM